jgi:peroxiredoxin
MQMHPKAARAARLLLVASTVAALSATPALAGEMAPAESAGATVGTKAPDFTLTDATGKVHSLKDYAGKIVVLEWTNPGCPFVVEHYKPEKMTMTRLAEKVTGQGVVWLAINTTFSNKPADTQTWSKEKGITYPTLLDPTGEVGRAYGAKTTPHMFVIGKDGKVAYAGAIDDNPRGEVATPNNYVDAAVSALLAGKPVEVSSTKSYGCSVKYAAQAPEQAKAAKSES